MKTSTQKRIARPSGLLLLSLLVVALAVPAAQAFPSQRSTLVQLAQAHRDRDRQTVAASGTSNAAQSQPGWAWGVYYSDAGASKLLAAGAPRGYYSTVAASGTSNAAQSQPGWAWGFYYSDAGASKLLAAGAPRGYYSTVAASGTVNIAQRPTTAQLLRAHNGHSGPSGISGGGTANAAQSASSGISTSVWIAAAAVLGAVLIGGWALLRRRRRREAAPACEFSAQGC